MRISKSGVDGYEGISWMDSLIGIKNPIKDQEAHLISKLNSGEENIDNALDVAANAAFGTPTKERKQEEVIQEASRKALDSAAKASESAYAQLIKKKLADSNVDPVALGVVKKEDWDACVDPKRLDAFAVQAAQKQIAINKQAWQKEAMKPSNAPSGFDNNAKDGKIVPMAGVSDDAAPVVQRQVPVNANSIFDPGRLDRLVEQMNSHDTAVATSKKTQAEQAAKSKDWRTEAHKLPEDVMNGSSVRRAGGNEYEETRYKVPSNQISILDDISANNPKELKDKISALFTDKVRDNGALIKEQNQKRAQEIQRPVETKPLMENKPSISTNAIQQRLMDLWAPKKK